MNLISWLQMNGKYLGNPAWDSGKSPPELLDVLSRRSPGNALDLGCGTGTNLVTMARYGWQVTGVDFVPLAVWKARRALHRAGVSGKVFCQNVTRIGSSGKDVDLIVDIGCYHNLSPVERKSYQRQVEVFLAAGGEYLLYAHWRHPNATHGIDEKDLDALQTRLSLIWRKDCCEREYLSVWVLMRKGEK